MSDADKSKLDLTALGINEAWKANPKYHQHVAVDGERFVIRQPALKTTREEERRRKQRERREAKAVMKAKKTLDDLTSTDAEKTLARLVERSAEALDLMKTHGLTVNADDVEKLKNKIETESGRMSYEGMISQLPRSK